MKKQHFTLLPLAVFVAMTVQAETADTVLDVIRVVGNNTGAKTKTDVSTIEKADKSTDTDLRSRFSAEPSIGFGGGNGTSQWVTIRGMGQDQIDIKVDDTYSDAQIFHHQGRFMSDPSLYKVVSVQKGTGSASAGIGATSGSIVAETVSAKDLLKEGRDYGVKLSTGFSSNKGEQKGITVFGKADSVDALLSGNWVKEKNYKAGNGQKVDHSGLGQRGLLAKVGLDINEDHRLELSHRQEFHYGERNLREEFDFTLADPTSTNNNPRYRETQTDTTNLQWTGQNMGFVSRVKANAYVSNTKRSEWSSGVKSQTKIETQGANLNLDSAIGNNHMIKYGVNWRREEGKPNSLSAGLTNQKKDDLGVYAEGIWGINAFMLTTGLRYDHFSYTSTNGQKASKGSFNPSVGLIWETTPDLSFNTSLNYATRSPRFYEVMLAYASTVNIADNIKPERARNVEVGFNYKLADHLSLNGSYFWQNIRDVLAYETISGGRTGGVYRLYNGGKLRNNGYEVGVNYKYAGFTARAGVAYSKPKLDGASVDSTYQAIPIGRTWTTGLAYKFDTPSVELGWRGRFVESASYDTTQSNRGGGSTTVTNKRPGYGVNDFYINWEAVKDLNINLSLNNAFNKYYRSHSQRYSDSSLPGVGRDYRISMNYTF